MAPTDDTLIETQQNETLERPDFFKAMNIQREMMKKRDERNRQNKLLFPTPEL